MDQFIKLGQSRVSRGPAEVGTWNSLRRSTRRPPRPSLRMMVPAKPARSTNRFRHETKQNQQFPEHGKRTEVATHRCRRGGRSVRRWASPPPPLLRAPAGVWRPAATQTLASYPGLGLRKGLGFASGPAIWAQRERVAVRNKCAPIGGSVGFM
jgi:hypothetical protein